MMYMRDRLSLYNMISANHSTSYRPATIHLIDDRMHNERYIPRYSQVKEWIENSKVYIDLKQSVVYDIVDYDKTYEGLQLVLGDKAIRFDNVPYHVVPMIYDNKLFGIDANSGFTKIVGPIQDLPSIEVSAIQLGSAILPIAVDPKAIMRSKEDYQSEVFDLLWRLIGGDGGTTVDQMLKDAKKYIHEFKDSKKSYDFR